MNENIIFVRPTPIRSPHSINFFCIELSEKLSIFICILSPIIRIIVFVLCFMYMFGVVVVTDAMLYESQCLMDWCHSTDMMALASVIGQKTFLQYLFLHLR